jgi:hypothetical protein
MMIDDKKKYLYCEFEEGPNWTAPKCSKPTEKGHFVCPDHAKRFPFWPTDTKIEVKEDM